MTGPGPSSVVSAQARILSTPLMPPVITPNYQITAIESVVLRLADADGVVGHSYLWCFGQAQANLLVEALRYLAPLCVGRAAEPAAFASAARTEMNFLGFKGVTVFGYSAYDLALHDVVCRRLSSGLADLRGRRRDRVPIYWSGFFLNESIDELVEEAQRASAAGFTAFKLRVGGPSLAEDVRRVAAVVEASPADTTILLDAVQAWDAELAIEAARALASYEPRWLEDPLVHHDYRGLDSVVRASPVAIATGENEYLREGFDQLIEARPAYLLADLQRVGGITEWDAVAVAARGASLTLTPHVYPHTSTQLAASLDQQETWVEYVPWWDELMTYRLDIRDGCVTVPDVVGNGIDLDPEQVERRATTEWIQLHPR